MQQRTRFSKFAKRQNKTARDEIEQTEVAFDESIGTDLLSSSMMGCPFLEVQGLLMHGASMLCRTHDSYHHRNGEGQHDTALPSPAVLLRPNAVRTAFQEVKVQWAHQIDIKSLRLNPLSPARAKSAREVEILVS